MTARGEVTVEGGLIDQLIRDQVTIHEDYPCRNIDFRKVHL